jgi:hypothetical protein
MRVERTALLLGVTGKLQIEDGVARNIVDRLWTPGLAPTAWARLSATPRCVTVDPRRSARVSFRNTRPARPSGGGVARML